MRRTVEGQRQSPVALAGDAPVAHVVEPVLHPLADVVGLPRRPCARPRSSGARTSSQPMNHSSHEAEDQRRSCSASTPDSCAVQLDRRSCPELSSAAATSLGDAAASRPGSQPKPETNSPTPSTGAIDVRLAQLLGARSPRGPQPGAMWTMPVPSSPSTSLPRDHPVLDLGLTGEVGEERLVVEADQLGALETSCSHGGVGQARVVLRASAQDEHVRPHCGDAPRSRAPG